MEKLNFIPIFCYEGLYKVNELGEIFSERTNKILKPLPDKDGYSKVLLYGNGKPRRFFVHRLVAYHFIANPDDKPCVNHKNEIKNDNRVDNLEWVTHLENNLYNGKSKRVGITNTNNPLTSKSVGQYTFEGELVRVFPSAKECGRNGFDQGHVSACCRGDAHYHKGFHWRYIE